MLSYPDENSYDPEQESHFLEEKTNSPNGIEIVAIVNGRVVGTAGIEAVGTKYKVRHRAKFGISVLKEYWGLGLGKALTRACIECAREAGYVQLELNVVAENKKGSYNVPGSRICRIRTKSKGVSFPYEWIPGSNLHASDIVVIFKQEPEDTLSYIWIPLKKECDLGKSIR